MHVEPKRITSDDGKFVFAFIADSGRIELGNASVYTRDQPTWFAAMAHAAQHGIFCAEPLKPLEWQQANEWTWVSGEYTIVAYPTAEYHQLLFRGNVMLPKRPGPSLADAQSAANAHHQRAREGKS